MKIHRFEAHDRLTHLKKDQSANIFKGAEDCLKKNSLSLSLQEKSDYVYLFAHPRTLEDGVTKALYWQPRLSRPKPQTNSYLFRAKSKTDIIEVCWLIPPREHWNEYIPGKVTADNLCMLSINNFRYNRNLLEKEHPEDLNEERGSQILSRVLLEKKQKIAAEKQLGIKPMILEATSL